MKRRIVALITGVVLAMGLSAAPAMADPGGGPGANNGCAGHQPPPPPSGGCH